VRSGSHLNQNKQNSLAGTDIQHQKRAADFVRAVERVLRPICRLLVRRGIGIINAIELLKRAYLQGAADVAAEQGLPVTPRRLQLYTGIPRAEVERLRSTVAANVDLSEDKIAAVSRLLTMWHVDHRYVLPFVDTPRELPLDGDDEAPSFATLAKECAPQFNPKELLEELVRANAVLIDPDTNKLHVVARTYFPEPFSETDSERFGAMLSAYAITMDCNTRKAGPGLGRFDRHTTADFSISLEDEEEFHRLVRTEGQKTLELLDAWLAGRERAPESGRRPGAAIFFFAHTDVQADGTEEQGAPRGDTPETVTKKTLDDGGDNDDAVIDTLTFRFIRGKK
jgi:hypothetical protein